LLGIGINFPFGVWEVLVLRRSGAFSLRFRRKKKRMLIVGDGFRFQVWDPNLMYSTGGLELPERVCVLR
jgi:hypothetical protein